MDRVYRPEIPKREDLKMLYDICNKLFNKKECFYTKEEVKKLKEDKENKFLQKRGNDMNFTTNEKETIAELTNLKIIEDRYFTLKRYLRIFFSNSNFKKKSC